MPVREYSSRLLEDIRRVTTADRMQWLRDALSAIEAGNAQSSWFVAVARARRVLGSRLLGCDAAPLMTSMGELSVAKWAVGNAARVVLLLNALARHPGEDASLLAEVYHLGDESEKRALIAGIALYAADDRHKPLALHCGRANSLRLFRAIAVGNPYPAACYSTDEFNQLVLKALFQGVDTCSIIGLEARANKALSRMCEDYHDELVVAGRPVPPDIWLSILPHASERGRDLVQRALHADDRRHRYYAALAVQRHGARGLGSVVEERRQRERDPKIFRLLISAIMRERNEIL